MSEPLTFTDPDFGDKYTFIVSTLKPGCEVAESRVVLDSHASYAERGVSTNLAADQAIELADALQEAATRARTANQFRVASQRVVGS